MLKTPPSQFKKIIIAIILFALPTATFAPQKVNALSNQALVGITAGSTAVAIASTFCIAYIYPQLDELSNAAQNPKLTVAQRKLIKEKLAKYDHLLNASVVIDAFSIIIALAAGSKLYQQYSPPNLNTKSHKALKWLERENALLSKEIEAITAEIKDQKQEEQKLKTEHPDLTAKLDDAEILLQLNAAPAQLQDTQRKFDVANQHKQALIKSLEQDNNIFGAILIGYPDNIRAYNKTQIPVQLKNLENLKKKLEQETKDLQSKLQKIEQPLRAAQTTTRAKNKKISDLTTKLHLAHKPIPGEPIDAADAQEHCPLCDSADTDKIAAICGCDYGKTLCRDCAAKIESKDIDVGTKKNPRLVHRNKPCPGCRHELF